MPTQPGAQGIRLMLKSTERPNTWRNESNCRAAMPGISVTRARGKSMTVSHVRVAKGCSYTTRKPCTRPAEGLGCTTSAQSRCHPTKSACAKSAQRRRAKRRSAPPSAPCPFDECRVCPPKPKEPIALLRSTEPLLGPSCFLSRVASFGKACKGGGGAGRWDEADPNKARS